MNPQQSKILSVQIDVFQKIDIKNKINTFLKSGKSHHIITANSIMIKQAYSNTQLQESFKKASLVIADSIGVVLAARFLNQPVPLLCPGIDFMNDCFAVAEEKKLSVFLLGSTQGTIEKAADNLNAHYKSVAIVGKRNGYFKPMETQSLIDDINALKPDFLFLGIDSPRQEIWIAQNREKLNVPIIVGVGGSFDIISGRLKRAPYMIRCTGLEWIFRTIQQPWRLWRIRQLPLFILLVILQKLKLLYKKH